MEQRKTHTNRKNMQFVNRLIVCSSICNSKMKPSKNVYAISNKYLKLERVIGVF
jgi:hypothetical protein